MWRLTCIFAVLALLLSTNGARAQLPTTAPATAPAIVEDLPANSPIRAWFAKAKRPASQLFVFDRQTGPASAELARLVASLDDDWLVLAPVRIAWLRFVQSTTYASRLAWPTAAVLLYAASSAARSIPR